MTILVRLFGALALLAAPLLLGCNGSDSTRAPTVHVNPMAASAWEIGPVIDGVSHSPGVPLHPYAVADGWGFDFPPFPGSVHYVTARLGPLTGKTRIVLRYRVIIIDGDIIPATGSAGQLAIGPTLYFQRRGDNWTHDGWRWWSTFMAPVPIVAGDHELVVPLVGPWPENPGNPRTWTSVENMDAINNSAEFLAAKANADRVGFTFGGGSGYGHGVYATGRARFIVTAFNVE